MIKQRENIITSLPKINRDILEETCIEDIYTKISVQLLKCMSCPFWGECVSNKILRNTRFDIEKYVVSDVLSKDKKKGNKNE